MCFEKPEELLDLLQSYTGNIEVIHPYVHADCRKRLIDVRKRSGEDTVGRSTQKSRRISSNRVLKWEDKCILCAQHIVSPDKKHPNRNFKVHSVSILSLKDNLLETARERER